MIVKVKKFTSPSFFVCCVFKEARRYYAIVSMLSKSKNQLMVVRYVWLLFATNQS